MAEENVNTLKQDTPDISNNKETLHVGKIIGKANDTATNGVLSAVNNKGGGWAGAPTYGKSMLVGLGVGAASLFGGNGILSSALLGFGSSMLGRDIIGGVNNISLTKKGFIPLIGGLAGGVLGFRYGHSALSMIIGALIGIGTSQLVSRKFGWVKDGVEDAAAKEKEGKGISDKKEKTSKLSKANSLTKNRELQAGKQEQGYQRRNTVSSQKTEINDNKMLKTASKNGLAALHAELGPEREKEYRDFINRHSLQDAEKTEMSALAEGKKDGWKNGANACCRVLADLNKTSQTSSIKMSV